jgi:hypothetical protein
LYAGLYSSVSNYLVLFGAAAYVYTITLPGGVFADIRRQ